MSLIGSGEWFHCLCSRASEVCCAVDFVDMEKNRLETKAVYQV